MTQEHKEKRVCTGCDDCCQMHKSHTLTQHKEKECNCAHFQKPLYHHGVRSIDSYKWGCPVHGYQEKHFTNTPNEVGQSIKQAKNKTNEKVCERDCPDFGGLELLHKETCACSCHTQHEDWEAKYDAFFKLKAEKDGVNFTITRFPQQEEIKSFIKQTLAKQREEVEEYVHAVATEDGEIRGRKEGYEAGRAACFKEIDEMIMRRRISAEKSGMLALEAELYNLQRDLDSLTTPEDK